MPLDNEAQGAKMLSEQGHSLSHDAGNDARLAEPCGTRALQPTESVLETGLLGTSGFPV